MGRITSTFEALGKRGERALVPYLAAGDPDLGTTAAMIVAMAEAGADLIEIGVPFSDPIADGPTIQRATERALRRGTTLRRILELVRTVRDQVSVPLVLMGSANPFYAMTPRGFAERAAEAGVDGLIVPDLPPEEGAELYDALAGLGVDGVLLAAPTTTPERLALLVEHTRGFLYYVSLTGVTGARSELASGLEEAVAGVRAISSIPVCVGFGVSTPEHAARIGRFADGVVVGSALVKLIEDAPDADGAVEAVAGYVAQLKQPLRAGADDR